MASPSALEISGGEKWMCNLSQSVREFQQAELFCDVTLVCGDQLIQAHSLMLSASSSLFKMILEKTPKPFYPFIYLKGIELEDLRSLLKFIYTGTVTVPTTNILRLLEAARELQIKGLGRGTEEEGEATPPPRPPQEMERPEPELLTVSVSQSDFDVGVTIVFAFLHFTNHCRGQRRQTRRACQSQPQCQQSWGLRPSVK